MNIEINSLYNQFFPDNGFVPDDWKPFKNYKADQSQRSLKPDISIKGTWRDSAKKAALISLQILILPWGILVAAKALMHRVVMLFALPAQLLFCSEKITELRKRVESVLSSEGAKDFISREVLFEKNGMKYNGLMLGHKSHISNGKWALFATGNATCLESAFLNRIPIPYLKAGFNVLLVNGPGVGRSQGPATPERIGDAQEAALTFLESAVKAKKIVMAGHSLGGAAIGLAALAHKFKSDVRHLAIRLMTFDRFTHIVAKHYGYIAEKLISLFGVEMDSVLASKKMVDEGIHEVIIQGGNDPLMNRVTLLEALQKEHLMKNKTGVLLPMADHDSLPDETIIDEIQKWDRSLVPALAG